MKLVENAGSAWRWFSMQAMAANLAMITTWNLLPPAFQEAIPAKWVLGMAVGLILLGMIGRMAKQDV